MGPSWYIFLRWLLLTTRLPVFRRPERKCYRLQIV